MAKGDLGDLILTRGAVAGGEIISVSIIRDMSMRQMDIGPTRNKVRHFLLLFEPWSVVCIYLPLLYSTITNFFICPCLVSIFLWLFRSK